LWLFSSLKPIALSTFLIGLTSASLYTHYSHTLSHFIWFEFMFHSYFNCCCTTVLFFDVEYSSVFFELFHFSLFNRQFPPHNQYHR
jgi:hypothetical protein